MQTSFDRTTNRGIRGALADTGFKQVDSMAATEEMFPGDGLVRVYNTANKVRLPIANQAIITDDAGTYTAGNFPVTVNGDLSTVTYDTNKDTTLTAVAVAIEAHVSVSTAVYDNSAHTITITGVSEETTVVSVDISGITGNMTMAVTSASSDTIHSIALHDAGIMQQGTGTVIVNDKAVLTLSGDVLNTSDTITATVNGTALSAITYATSEAATLIAFAAQLEAVVGIKSVTIDSRVLTVLNNEGLILTINSIVVAEDTTASVAPAFAISASSQNSAGIGDTKYLPGKVVSALRQGRILVYVEEAVTVEDSPHVRFKVSGDFRRGDWRTDVDTDKALAVTGARYVEGAAAGALAVVEINYP